MKGTEPASLTQHRCTEHGYFDNYGDTDGLRRALVAEQRCICCYCLCGIRPSGDAMKVEHWHCQDRYPAEQLDYGNLLGACLGNTGSPLKHQHCDTRKGNSDLSRNPANPSHHVETLARYLGDGTIKSDDPGFDREINEVLNLNVSHLKDNRKAVLDAFKVTLQKRGSLKRITLERLLADWDGQSHANSLRPYCQVVVYWLRKRLARE